MTLRVLLIESEAEELLFLEEVLREIEQERWLPEWPRIEPLCAATWAEAERMVRTSPPHAILLHVEPLAEVFRLAQAAAPEVPVIVLLEGGDEALATRLMLGTRLMRDGAEDFLFKGQIDGALLAHTLRNAVLRHRLLSAARAGSLTDSLTGLANRAGFLTMAARDRHLAQRLDLRWMLLVAEPRALARMSPPLVQQRRDLELLGAAEHLRGIATPADLVGRIGDRHFAMSVFDGEVETLEEAWVRIRRAAAERRMDVGAAIFERTRPRTLDALLEQALADLPHLPETTHSKTAGAA
jgi:GGDEF domain-containing protein